MQNINIIGGGLAGSEAAIYLANKGYTVNLYEMRPKKTTGAHTTADFAEFVCSNSLGSIALTSASGLLKKEIEILGSSLICLAKEHSVPSGNSLSIDRFGFSAAVSDIIRNHENINIINEEITEIPVSADTITLVATGPLTSSALSNAIKNAFGEEHFSFFDAVAPIVKKDSINFDTAFFGARWGKGDDDFINCPMEKDDYEKLLIKFLQAKQVIFISDLKLGFVSYKLKNIIDRLSSWSHTNGLIGKKSIIVSTASHSGLLAVKKYMEAVCTAFGTEIIGEVFVTENSSRKAGIVEECVLKINAVLKGQANAVNSDLLDEHFTLLKKMTEEKQISFSEMEIKELTKRGFFLSNSFKEFKENAERSL